MLLGNQASEAADANIHAPSRLQKYPWLLRSALLATCAFGHRSWQRLSRSTRAYGGWRVQGLVRHYAGVAGQTWNTPLSRFGISASMVCMALWVEATAKRVVLASGAALDHGN